MNEPFFLSIIFVSEPRIQSEGIREMLKNLSLNVCFALLFFSQMIVNNILPVLV